GSRAPRSPALAGAAGSPYRSGHAPYCVEYSRACGAVERSTEEPRNSSTILRANPTPGEFVWILIRGSTLREQAGTSAREPDSSRTETRQTFTGVKFSR